MIHENSSCVNARRIPIVISLDQNYYRYVKTMFESLFEKRNERVFYEIVVLVRNLNAAAREDLSKYIASKGNASIRFMEVPSVYFEKYHFPIYPLSEAAYYRLFIPSLLPEYEKIIYLDIDIIVTGDIAELYDLELGDCYLAAIPDIRFNADANLRHYAEIILGLPKTQPYFNSGILVINLRQCRKDKMEKKFLNLLSTLKFIQYHDQCILNAACFEKTLLLDYGWNFQLFNLSYLIDPASLRGDIKIVHFLADKPWRHPNHPNAQLWWKYHVPTQSSALVTYSLTDAFTRITINVDQ